jgi:hypothetical protein
MGVREGVWVALGLFVLFLMGLFGFNLSEDLTLADCGKIGSTVIRGTVITCKVVPEPPHSDARPLIQPHP